MFFVRTHKYHEALETIREKDLRIKELNRQMDRLNDDYSLREQKAVHALEAKTQREIVKIKSACTKEISELKVKHAEELASVRSNLAKQNYDKLSESMTKLHEQGNATTKFMEKIAINTVDAFGKNNQYSEKITIENKSE